jgi:alpha-beta hydrolase superfamily lysophospholipase
VDKSLSTTERKTLSVSAAGRRVISIVVKIAAIYLVISALAGFRLAEITFHPVRRELPRERAEHPERIFQPPDEAREVALHAGDGVELRAWYLRSANDNRDAVIMLHGLSDNRLAGAGLAPLFLRQGYRVLLPDSRGHGESGGFATFGIKEAGDIHEWVSWLYANDAPRCVYGFGQSMGAAILLQALPGEKRFCAAVADSPFATFREAAYEHTGEFLGLGPRWFGRTLGRPIIFLGLIYGLMRYHVNLMNADPEGALVATKVPVLLIHGLADDDLLPENSVELHNAAPAHTELWLVAGAQHTGAHKAQPQQFEERMLNWFKTHS